MSPEQTEIVVSLTDSIARRYDIRKAHTGSTLEATLPREAVEREARRIELTLEQFIDSYKIEWLYNDFSGLYARFVPRKK